MSVAGSIESVSIKGRYFAVASDADASMKTGGFENETQPNGDGTARTIKTRVAWALTGLTLAVDHSRGDLEFLQGISDAREEVACSVTYADGSTYSGSGTINGELAVSSQSGTAEVALGGSGKLTKL